MQVLVFFENLLRARTRETGCQAVVATFNADYSCFERLSVGCRAVVSTFKVRFTRKLGLFFSDSLSTAGSTSILVDEDRIGRSAAAFSIAPGSAGGAARWCWRSRGVYLRAGSAEFSVVEGLRGPAVPAPDGWRTHNYVYVKEFVSPEDYTRWRAGWGPIIALKAGTPPPPPPSSEVTTRSSRLHLAAAAVGWCYNILSE